MIVVIWVLALAISIGPPLGWKGVDQEGEECGVNKQLDYVIFSVVGSFYLPMLVIVVLYFQVKLLKIGLCATFKAKKIISR